MLVKTSILISALAGLALAAWTPFQLTPSEQNTQVSESEIKKLIEQLGDKDFREREAATKKLMSIGAPAIRDLEKAAISGEAEVRLRSKTILDKLGMKEANGLVFKLAVETHWVGKRGKQTAFAVKIEVTNLGRPCRLNLSDTLFVNLKSPKGDVLDRWTEAERSTRPTIQNYRSLKKGESATLSCKVTISVKEANKLVFGWEDCSGKRWATNRDYPAGPYDLTVRFNNAQQPNEDGFPFWTGELESRPAAILISYEIP